jgi:phage terminase large subunit-like protein
MILTVPHDVTLYPSLGAQVCDFIEQNLVFGPGDLRGEPMRLDDERRGLIWRLYEVYPQGHPQAGRRRFKRACLSLPKGLGKTEFAAVIAACELHPEGPVRCVGWTSGGDPIGGPVTDPFIPMVAFTEEQSDELCYAALRVILEESPIKDDFDIGLQRILRRRGDGIAISLSSNPNARDGARTTFQIEDETHRFVLARQKQAHHVMQANLPKRRLADAWGLEVTTAPEPGVGSVAEDTMEYAKAVEQGRIADASLFYFHRQAGDEHDLTTPEGIRAAIVEASGAAASWRDIEAIAGQWHDPTVDPNYLQRVWLNRVVKSSTQAFDVTKWKALARSDSPVALGDPITVGFDGALFHDATALVATHILTGYQWLVGLWEQPPQRTEWQVPVAEVCDAVAGLFEQYAVWRAYCDPPYWESWIAQWAGRWGKDRVVEWQTNRRRQMTAALLNFDVAIREGTLCHRGDPAMARHLGNSRKKSIPGWTDERGQALWTIEKERPDAPGKIDAAMAAVLSWEARTDALTAGVLAPPAEPSLVFLGARR